MKARLLMKLGHELARAQQWERAKTIWRMTVTIAQTIDYRETRALVLEELARSIGSFGMQEQLLHLVQTSWRQADTGEYAIKLLSLAESLIPLHPEIGTAFCEAFTWVDNFLKR